MKKHSTTGLIIVVLSIGIWLFLDSETGQIPNDQTVVILAGCALVVLTGKWIWTRVSKRRKSQ